MKKLLFILGCLTSNVWGVPDVIMGDREKKDTPVTTPYVIQPYNTPQTPTSLLIPSATPVTTPIEDAGLYSQAGTLLIDRSVKLSGSLAVSSATIGTISITTATISSGTIPSFMVVGTQTNNNAPVGRIGEYVSSWVTLTNAPTSGQWGDLTSISLTAGDWDVSIAQTGSYNGATVTVNAIGVGTISGNNAPNITNQAGDDSVEIALAATAVRLPSGSLPAVRVSLSATTTVYYKMIATYSVATPLFRGRISARRVR